MAGEKVDTDYHGQPVDHEITDADRAAMTREDLYGLCDATADTLDDGRTVWSCWDGFFLDKDGQPDRDQPVHDYRPPTVEEMLREADA